MKLPFLSQSKSLDPKLISSPTWPWPTCGTIKTLSFRASNAQNDAFCTTFLDYPLEDSTLTTSSSSLTNSTVISEDSNDDPIESVIRSLRSDRLFFEPDNSSSLLSSPLHDTTEQKAQVESIIDHKGYKETDILTLDSNNPYQDFRQSMEEMVEAHGLKDWQGLEKLLGWYLKINGKHNHGYIVGAFVDLLVSLSFVTSNISNTATSSTSSSSSSSCSLSSTHDNLSSPSSPLSLPSSSITTPCLSSILDHGDDGDDVIDDGHGHHHQHHCHVAKLSS